MAYFIVIGTDNQVKTVVDEVRESHLQHNIVTSGCVIGQDTELFYHWDVYNEGGSKTYEDERPSISLSDALTNQIAQFRALLPAGSIPNVFLIGSCYSDEEANRIKYVYDSLCEIGGATFTNLSIDIVLLGYNLNHAEDVTQTPDWKNLRNFEGIENGKFQTDVLYINNMDYDGAATNVDAKLLGRFLSHWAKMVSGGEANPKQTIQENHYAIGLAERQYNFEDLVPFFELAAEERILDRALHDAPAIPTQQMLNTKYYNRINLSKPWIDGLCSIKNAWENYCTFPYDYAKENTEQPYSLSLQKQKLTVYLNDWLKLYCKQQERDILSLKEQIDEIKQEIALLESQIPLEKTIDPDTGEEIESDEEKQLRQQISQKNTKIEDCQKQIQYHENNIESNTFADARLIKADLETGCLTDAQKESYESHLDSERELGEYLHNDRSVNTINEAIERAVHESDEIPTCPIEVLDNVGRLEELSFAIPEPPTQPAVPENTLPEPNIQSERKGCMGWFYGLFHKEEPSNEMVAKEPEENVQHTEPLIDIKELRSNVTHSIKEYRRVKEVENWWGELYSLVTQKEERQKQCILEMDGVIYNEGTSREYREGGFKVPFHRKSISLISVDKAREYRDGDSYYLEMVDRLKGRYFDSTIEDDKRQSMLQLIKHQVIDAIRGLWHTLKWDGSNPFCKEDLTPDDIHNFIEDPGNGMHKQSKPFVEYVKLDTNNITRNINYLFYFSHPGIETLPNEFRDKYQVSEGTLNPIYLSEFTNSLCEVQVLNVTDYVDSIADFEPQTEAALHESRVSFTEALNDIVGLASTKEDKAKAIYDWLCENISYDTTYQIHDADTCWKTKRGVCQAYCELFVHLAKLVGVTAEIITGISKNAKGEISEKKHAWIFVYTHAYDGFLIDPTWGAGGIDGRKFVKSDENSMWFNVSPYWMIFSHFPDQEYWTKLGIQITEEQFKKLPYMNPSKENDGKDVLFDSLSALEPQN